MSQVFTKFSWSQDWSPEFLFIEYVVLLNHPIEDQQMSCEYTVKHARFRSLEWVNHSNVLKGMDK